MAQFGSVLEWGSRGRKFESSHPDVPEAKKIKASGFFVALVILLRIAINHVKSRSTTESTTELFFREFTAASASSVSG